jgi:HAD superfamily hydrolase (TIGR01509 family)
MLKALLFDLDGTLTETDSIHFLIWRDFLRPYGLEIDPVFYKAKISGRLNPDIVAELVPQLNPEQQSDFIWRKEAEFRNRADALKPLPGLLNLLDWARAQNLQVAVVSNAPKENVEFMLRALQLETAFATVVLGDDLPKGKPDPLPYQEALRRFNLSSAEAIAFEDSPSGIRSAVGAGIFTVGIASTYEPAELRRLGANLIANDFTDQQLIELLNQLLNQPSQNLANSSAN